MPIERDSIERQNKYLPFSPMVGKQSMGYRCLLRMHDVLPSQRGMNIFRAHLVEMHQVEKIQKQD